jgi:hypothetical protein
MSEKDAKQGVNADRDKFRAELLKAMPGYQWKVLKGRPKDTGYLEAVGIQSSGFNRTSTLMVILSEDANKVASYNAKSAGFGTKSPWLLTGTGKTLLQALRQLQDRYEAAAQEYACARDALIRGRSSPSEENNQDDDGLTASELIGGES